MPIAIAQQPNEIIQRSESVANVSIEPKLARWQIALAYRIAATRYDEATVLSPQRLRPTQGAP